MHRRTAPPVAALNRTTAALASFFVLSCVLGSAVLAQPGTPGPRQRRGQAIEAMIESQGPVAIQKFAEEHLAPGYRESFAPGALAAHLEKIRSSCAGFGGVTAGPADGGGTRLTFMKPNGTSSVVFRIDEQPPHPIVSLELEAGEAAPAGVQVAPIPWDQLEQRLDEEAKAGFSGTVLVARGGKIILHHGYGFANREKKIPNGTESIFAIGSVPIEFTRAAILQLAERKKLSTSDPITQYFDEVPADKHGMTLEHLMTGASGLPDFHHLASDADRDLSWIDRSTAIRRILAQPLKFAPGTGDAHSHSAWVLLAAIVEIVSGKPYGEYLRTQFFVPAGMTRTGNHEDGARFPDDAFAIGYEAQPVGKVNIPKYWGKTSWLVMGSGGMQSTPQDLYRWFQAIRNGTTQSPASAAVHRQPAVAVGGDDRGFLCMIGWNANDLVIFCSNAHAGPRDYTAAVGRRLMELVRD